MSGDFSFLQWESLQNGKTQSGAKLGRDPFQGVCMALSHGAFTLLGKMQILI